LNKGICCGTFRFCAPVLLLEKFAKWPAAPMKKERIMTRNVLRLCALVLAIIPCSASAHVGAGHTHTFVDGFSHPLGGTDHILAMVAVGLFAAHLGGRALWLVPLTFLSMMTIACLLGMADVWLPFVEIGIGMSVVVLGLAIALQLHSPTLGAMGLVGFFAIFHGHAHGTEMAQSVDALTYGAGFVCATALLHAVGIALGTATAHARKKYRRRIIQVSGGAIAVAGGAILAGIL
jgi:urease accessory protein